MTVPATKIFDLAHRLEAGFGTDTELGDVIDALSHDEALQLDALVFECARCNHWFRQRENATPDSAEWVCKGCNDDDKN